MNPIKMWLMSRYCPSLWFSVPYSDDNEQYRVEVIMAYGYFGHKRKVVRTELVQGLKQAYFRVRWLALLADWRYPAWLYDCGIHYGIKNELGKDAY